MNATTQYIETYRKTDKNRKFYYTEKWVDTTYNGDLSFTHTTVFSGRTSKEVFERRMQNTVFVEKNENFIMFEN